MIVLQYFVNYNFDDGWYIASNPTMTADWSMQFQVKLLFPK